MVGGQRFLAEDRHTGSRRPASPQPYRHIARPSWKRPAHSTSSKHPWGRRWHLQAQAQKRSTAPAPRYTTATQLRAFVAIAVIILAVVLTVQIHSLVTASGEGDPGEAQEQSEDQEKISEEERDNQDGTSSEETVTDSGIAYSGQASLDGSPALEDLEEALQQCRDNDITVSIDLHDIDKENGSRITYQPEDRVYSASAIKGPYSIFVYQDLVETGKLNHDTVYPVVKNVINQSSNSDYASLRTMSEESGWSAWLADAGIDTDSHDIPFDYNWYADMSAREFVLAWKQGYRYLTSGTDDAKELSQLFLTTPNSPLHMVLGNTYQVWSKAGWFSDETEDASPTMNDAGIVFSDTGPYVIAVCTDSASDSNLVNRIVNDLNCCHGQLTGGNSAPLWNPSTAIPSASESVTQNDTDM